MDNRDKVKPHELAARISQAGYEVNQGRVESERLGNLITRSEGVWRELKRGRYEEDENGYATIGIEDWVGDYRTDSGDNVDALNMFYHDPKGNITPLGRIARLEPHASKATVYVAVGEEKLEPLFPQDPRWDAVVGVAERAVDAAYQSKPRPSNDH